MTATTSAPDTASAGRPGSRPGLPRSRLECRRAPAASWCSPDRGPRTRPRGRLPRTPCPARHHVARSDDARCASRASRSGAGRRPRLDDRAPGAGAKEAPGRVRVRRHPCVGGPDRACSPHNARAHRRRRRAGHPAARTSLLSCRRPRSVRCGQAPPRRGSSRARPCHASDAEWQSRTTAGRSGGRPAGHLRGGEDSRDPRPTTLPKRAPRPSAASSRRSAPTSSWTRSSRTSSTSSRSLFGTDVEALWLLNPGRHPLQLAAHHDLRAGPDRRRRPVDQRGPRHRPARDQRAALDRPRPPRDRRRTSPTIYVRQGFRTDQLRAARVPRRGARPARALPPHRRTTGRPTSSSCARRSPTRWRSRSPTPGCSTRSAPARPASARSRSCRRRLNRIQDVDGIGEAIVAEADRLIGHDTIRVYRVDHATQMCEPIAFQGEFAGHRHARRPSDLRRQGRRGPDRLGRAAQRDASGSATRRADRRGRQVGGEPRRRSRCCWSR